MRKVSNALRESGSSASIRFGAAESLGGKAARAAQARAREVRAAQIDVSEVGSLEVGPAQVHPAEIEGTGKRPVAVAPLGREPLLMLCEQIG